MSSNDDYCKFLYVPPTASLEEIRSAFRRMALKYHPTRTRALGPRPSSSRSTRPIRYSETPRNEPPMTQKDEPRPNVPRNANAANRGLATHSPNVQTKTFALDSWT